MQHLFKHISFTWSYKQHKQNAVMTTQAHKSKYFIFYCYSLSISINPVMQQFSHFLHLQKDWIIIKLKKRSILKWHFSRSSHYCCLKQLLIISSAPLCENQQKLLLWSSQQGHSSSEPSNLFISSACSITYSYWLIEE